MTHLQPYVVGADEARIIETAEINLIVQMKAKLSIDGDMYCWLAGDDLMTGVAGFGKSPHLAALDFNKNFYKELPSKSHLSQEKE